MKRWVVSTKTSTYKPYNEKGYRLTVRSKAHIISTYSKKGKEMIKFLVGMVFGLVIATVGFSGVAQMITNTATNLDKGAEVIKSESIKLAK